MAMMKLDTHIGQVLDPTRGAQKALSNVGTIMAQADQIRARKVEEARQAKADARADVLFGQQQDEYQRKLGVRNATTDLAKGFDNQTVRPEDVLLNMNNDVVQKYNEITNNGQRELTPEEMRIFNAAYTDGYNPTKEEVNQYVSNKILAAGGDATDAAKAQALLSQGFDSKKELLANEAARVKSYNDAEKDRAKNAYDQIKLAKDIDKSNASRGGSGSSGKGKYPYSGGDIQKVYESIKGIASPDFMLKWDDSKSQQAIESLVNSGKISPNEAKAYVLSKLRHGTFGDNYDLPDSKEMGNDAVKFVNNLRSNNGYARSLKPSVPKLTDKQIALMTPNYVSASQIDEILANRNNYKKILNRLGSGNNQSSNKTTKKTSPKKEVLNPISQALNKSGTNPDVFNLFAKDPVAFGKEYAKLGSSDKKRVDKLLATDKYKKLLKERDASETAKQFKAPTLDELDALANARQERLNSDPNIAPLVETNEEHAARMKRAEAYNKNKKEEQVKNIQADADKLINIYGKGTNHLGDIEKSLLESGYDPELVKAILSKYDNYGSHNENSDEYKTRMALNAARGNRLRNLINR